MKHDGVWGLKGVASHIRTIYNDTCSDYATFTDVTKYLKWIDDSIKAM